VQPFSPSSLGDKIFERLRRTPIASGARRAGGLTTIKKTFVKIKERFGSKLLSDITTKDYQLVELDADFTPD
jgi:hypothetical protein